jgi:hypothetical protein
MVSTTNKKEMARLKNQSSAPVVFHVVPFRVELVPGETKEIAIEGSSDKPQLIEETQVCTSIVGKMSGKDKIMRFKIRCEFIAPVVSFSTRNLVFRLGIYYFFKHTILFIDVEKFFLSKQYFFSALITYY